MKSGLLSIDYTDFHDFLLEIDSQLEVLLGTVCLLNYAKKVF